MSGSAGVRRAAGSPLVPVAGFTAACLAVFAINVLIDRDPEFVLSDGAGYYAWARSAVFDRDVAFANEYEAAPWPADGEVRGVDGGPFNKFSIGLSLIELIPIAIGSLLVEPFWPTRALRGYGGAHLLTLAVFLRALGTAAITLVLRQVRRDLGSRAAALAAWTLLGATALVEFGARLISYTHLVDVTLVLMLWRLAHRRGGGVTRHALLGGLAGLAVVVRMTNAVLLPWVAAWYVYRGHRPTRIDAIVAALAGALPIGVQLIANRAHRGVWLPEPYPGERFAWLSPQITDTLWSFDAGWLMWHPVHLVLIGGLALSWATFGRSRSGRAVWWTAVIAVAAQIWINASWWAWQGGAMQFGNRIFLALSPLLIVMTAYGTRLATHRATPVLLAALVVWNAYIFAGASVAKIRGHWDPDLRDALGWERSIVPAVRERWSRE